MISYVEKGKGSPVVLLHAFPLNGKMWERQLEHFSLVARVMVPDLTGFGKTPPREGVSMAAMAREVSELLDSLKISEPFFLAGLSMGGYVAFEFFRQFPQRVKALGLFATRATADTDTARENRFKSIEAMQSFGIGPFAKKAVKSQLGQTTQIQNPALMDTVLAMMNTTPAMGAIEAQKAMANRQESSDLLPRMSFPVLIVAGEEDILCPPSEMKTMHEKIIGSEFHVLPKAGHLVNLENAEAFDEIFELFFKKHAQSNTLL